MGLPVLSDSIDNYLVQIGRYPVLSPEDEQEVAKRYYATRNLEDAHRLVTSNLRYVVKIALEFRHYGARLADLIQEGNIGLMKAVKKFNPYKGFRLITYATWWIRSYIQDFILRTTSLVKKNTRALKRQLFYKTTAGVPNEGRANAPALDSTEALTELSLNSPIQKDPTGRIDNETFLDVLPDNRAPEDAIESSQSSAVLRKELSRALDSLNEKERAVIEKRFLSDPQLSLQEIGDMLGLTRERVRQIEARSIEKLRKALPLGLSMETA
jgi:RNA polymerase sigma-32 factor